VNGRIARKILKRALVLELRPGDVLLVKGLTREELDSAQEIFQHHRVRVVGVPDRMQVEVVAPSQEPT